MSTPAPLLRVRLPGAQRVTSIELFFDLVFVFAITQLSHLLADHLTVGGALETLLLLLAVRWAWMYTAWATNWLDPARRVTRVMLLGAMLASLVMAAALPEAFDDRGLAFALGYAAIQVGRTLFVLIATRPEPTLHANFRRIAVWNSAAGALWVAGGVAHGSARVVLWLLAVAVDYAGPMALYVVPGLGRAHVEEWSISGDHLAERCQLFLIVAFGESILVTGATLSDLTWTASTVIAVAVAFTGTVALWWIYFDATAERGSQVISASHTPGRLGRSAYTYWHLPMVAGIIVTAVADELVIAHPGGHTATATALTVLGGPALFLAGHALFKQTLFGHLSVQRVVAVVVLMGLIPLGPHVPPLLLGILAMVVLIAVAVTDAVLARTAPVPEPGPEFEVA
jgi:low temperature requirement protein LtrA